MKSISYSKLRFKIGYIFFCTQPFSNSPIHKSSLWFQYNSTKEWYDINCIACIGLKSTPVAATVSELGILPIRYEIEKRTVAFLKAYSELRSR